MRVLRDGARLIKEAFLFMESGKPSRKTGLTRPGIYLVAWFVLSTLCMPLVHAYESGHGGAAGATFSEDHTSAAINDGHGHSHDDGPADTPKSHTHGHNPADHSHDVPAVFMISDMQTLPPDCTDNPVSFGPCMAFSCFEIDRPPRV